MQNKNLTNVLKTLTPDDLHRLYMRVFNCDDGALVLQDLRNRSFYSTPTINYEGLNDAHAVGYREGMRGLTGHIEAMLTIPEEVIDAEILE